MSINAILIGEITAYLIITITSIVFMKNRESNNKKIIYWALAFILLPAISFIFYITHRFLSQYVRKIDAS